MWSAGEDGLFFTRAVSISNRGERGMGERTNRKEYELRVCRGEAG